MGVWGERPVPFWLIWIAVLFCTTTYIQGQRFRLWRGDVNEGLLQVKTQGGWYLVCSRTDAFSTKEANILCRGLGKPSGNAYLTGYGTYLVGDETLLEMGSTTFQFQCNGNETSFSTCVDPASIGVPQNGTCLLTIGVLCSNTAPQFRLSTDGRVEVRADSSWSRVCADDFSVKAVNTTCKTMNKPWTDGRPLKLRNKGSAEPVVGNLRCTGEEATLAQCTFVLSYTECLSDREAAVICQQATDLKFRLMNGSTVSSGRLEMWHNNRWGTVCGKGSFGGKEASVVCKSLGLQHQSARVVSIDQFGVGEGVIWLKDVNCTGSETNLLQCERHFDSKPVDTCLHDNDVAISCEGHRLEGDGVSGQLQVSHDGAWINVFGANFDMKAATVACRTVDKPRSGLTFVVEQAPASQFDDMLHVTSCKGSESSLLDCGYEWADPVALREENTAVTLVSLTCRPASPSNLKFRHPGRDRMGLYEVYNGTDWGTICGNGLTDVEARVACQHLGFGSSYAAVFGASYTEKGNGSVLLDGVSCAGGESSLSECDHNPLQVVTCNRLTHVDDLNIYCGTVEDNFHVRLVGDRDNGGRVEVRLYGSWGTVCEDGFDYNAAKVICRQLNLSISEPRATSIFPQGVGRVWLHGVNCTGEEESIRDCRYNPVRGPPRCTHEEDIGVVCSGTVVHTDDGLSGGAIAGVVIAILLLFALLILALCIGIRRWSAARRDLRSNLLKTGKSEGGGRAEYRHDSGVVNVAFDDSPNASRARRAGASEYTETSRSPAGYGHYNDYSPHNEMEDRDVPPAYHTLDLNSRQTEGSANAKSRPYLANHTPTDRSPRPLYREVDGNDFGFSGSSRDPVSDGRESPTRKVTGRHGRPPYAGRPSAGPGGQDNPEYSPRPLANYHPRDVPSPGYRGSPSPGYKGPPSPAYKDPIAQGYMDPAPSRSEDPAPEYRQRQLAEGTSV